MLPSRGKEARWNGGIPWGVPRSGVRLFREHGMSIRDVAGTSSAFTVPLGGYAYVAQGPVSTPAVRARAWSTRETTSSEVSA